MVNVLTSIESVVMLTAHGYGDDPSTHIAYEPVAPVLSMNPEAPYPGVEVVSFQEALEEVLLQVFDCVQPVGNEVPVKA